MNRKLPSQHDDRRGDDRHRNAVDGESNVAPARPVAPVAESAKHELQQSLTQSVVKPTVGNEPQQRNHIKDREAQTLAPDVNLVNIHLAEYQALTNRNTYHIYIQSTIWPMLLAALGLTSFAIGKVDGRLLAWGAAALVLCVTYIYYAFLIDEHKNSVYIETELRPLLEDLTGHRGFWKYEAWLAKTRHRGPQWWEYLPLLGAIVFAAAAACYRLPWGKIDRFGFGLTVFLVVANIAASRVAVRYRTAITRSK